MHTARRIVYVAMTVTAVPLTILVAIPVILLLALAYYVSLALTLFGSVLVAPLRRREEATLQPETMPSFAARFSDRVPATPRAR